MTATTGRFEAASRLPWLALLLLFWPSHAPGQAGQSACISAEIVDAGDHPALDLINRCPSAEQVDYVRYLPRGHHALAMSGRVLVGPLSRSRIECRPKDCLTLQVGEVRTPETSMPR